MLSYQSLMPAGAGTPRYEKRELWFWYRELAERIMPRPTPTPAGTSPSPRVVFDRATLTVVEVAGFSIDVLRWGIGAWIPAFAGMTKGGPD